ncbi:MULTISPECIES: NADH-quinone oxidoreductase subunit D [Winkia]|uniref:NADH-quinone oxidoreductase subunit D n=1 Tax=Winkia neuii subsp. anitrata TaxID=29318 RepID=A0AB38XMQ1_9ACTO|nr:MULTISPECIES: NADH-quinone oxidoreductase subunit D [Winkia]PMC93820.1 NADH dehydrogenase subunit D [Actinomyces sp. UMB0918]MDK6240324.1 NADH-quinone oxidoreductase subunit D [Winkia sp. UMB10116]MDK7163772.1 NADH-quinone oxidoreductase subunit D [Winkia sp. UMB3105]MDK8595217.1 NADH-quinone oxidoreductase subunit D [Winkia sp. UMB1096A]MDU2269720.1 NADH-quinone oxidoreductase subunit D [Winkia neuii]
MSHSTPLYQAAPPVIDDEDLPEFTSSGGDWDEVTQQIEQQSLHEKLVNERIVVNLGPVHPSTHGVLRLIVEIDGEIVRKVHVGTGYLHTGIEKNMEYRTWAQGSTFCTRMDYVASMLNEAAYVMAVEKLMGITDQISERARLIRVLMMELTRAASHIVAIGTTGNELGGTTLMTIAFRGREEIFRIFERVTGLRMNNAYLRVGGVAQDLPAGTTEYVRDQLPKVRRDLGELEDLIMDNPIFKSRFQGVSYISPEAIFAMGLTGPSLRAAGFAYDVRKMMPYSGYETLDFDVCTQETSDAYGRVRVRFDECYQSFRIIEQVLDRLDQCEGERVMVEDKAIAWPSQLSVAADGQGNSLEHIRHIMGTSMEALIHHFKLVTEGFKVPAGQATQIIEHAKGIMGCHVVSNGGTRPYRVHFREPSFSNLQSLSLLAEGGMISDLIVSLASLDPVLGGVDR